MEIDCVGDLFIACIVNNCAYLGVNVILDIIAVVIVRIPIFTLFAFGDAVKIYDWKNKEIGVGDRIFDIFADHSFKHIAPGGFASVMAGR